MQREFRRVNARHSAMRRGLVEPEHLTPYLERLGEEAVEQILASGIAGVSPEKTEDLKCLHAHLADYLCTRTSGVCVLGILGGGRVLFPSSLCGLHLFLIVIARLPFSPTHKPTPACTQTRRRQLDWQGGLRDVARHAGRGGGRVRVLLAAVRLLL